MTIDEARQDIVNIIEMDGIPIDRHSEKAIDDLIAAVREDERQKMYEMWKGMLP